MLILGNLVKTKADFRLILGLLQARGNVCGSGPSEQR